MENEKLRLLALAAALEELGREVDRAKTNLQILVWENVPYDSAEMEAAYDRLANLKAQWDALEAEYLTLRDKILGNLAQQLS